VAPLNADAWERRFGEDVRRLGSEILIHVCGESCFKYSGTKATQICRHGFYYIVSLADWRRRRRGKALRNSLCVIKQTKFGMHGRVLLFQEHPFECQSNYGALAAMRCNFDMQDLRRVLPAEHWLVGELPHLGDRPHYGYMNDYEWDGDDWLPRRAQGCEPLPDQPYLWDEDVSLEQWREVLLRCAAKLSLHQPPASGATDVKPLMAELIAAFSDGLNTGFYINMYTTKQLPSMEGVLEEMRRGLERLQQMRDARAAASVSEGDQSRRRPGKFSETLEVIKRLSASYRRCYWKSASEMLFPIFYGHMTFASHRCWNVFIKKGIFLVAEAWRRRFGRAVRHAALRDGGGEILQYNRAGMDPFPLLGWKRLVLEATDVVVYEGPGGEVFESLQEVYEHVVAARVSNIGTDKMQMHLSVLQHYLNECCSEKEERAEEDRRFVVTSSTLEDYLYRGDHPVVAHMSLYVYCMWVYRFEKPPPPRTGQLPAHRYIDMEFAPSYALRTSHMQRLATEFRVPLFEGSTAPSAHTDGHETFSKVWPTLGL